MIRRIVYLAAVIVTFYFAGVYQELPLLILFLAEVVLAAAMFVESHVRTIGMKASFSSRNMMAIRNRVCRISVNVRYGLPIPASRVRFILGVTHDGRTRRVRLDADVKEVHGRTGRYEIPLVMGQSGLWTVRLVKVCPQDSLGLFHGHRKGKDEMQAAVRPEIGPMRIARFFPGQIRSDRKEERTAAEGDSGQEIREMHAYRPGDRIRYVHWPVSAREDQLMVKEFEPEDERTATLYLDFNGSGRMDDVNRERFLTVLDAMLQGLLKSGIPVDVKWRTKEQVYRGHVENRREMGNVVWNLYRFPPEDTGAPLKWSGEFSDWRLTWNAQWYVNGRLIHAFSKSEYRQEIETENFSFSL